jgi:sarcosine oxidase
MSGFDTVVVGLGAMGSATAMHLARRGRRVLGVDRYFPPHDRGAHGGRSRLIRCAYYEGADYVPLARRAWDQWLALGAERGEELLTPTGALSMGPPGAEVVDRARHSAERWGLDHEMLDAAEVTRRWPVFRPDPGHVAIFETQAGFVRPEAAVAAMLATAAAAGATLRTGTEVTAWEADASSVRVVLRHGEVVEAGSLVLAAGPWAGRVLAGAGIPVEVERQVQYWFARPPDHLGGHPVFMHEATDGTMMYGAPAHDGFGTKVGIHYGGALCDPDAVDRTVTPGEVTRVRAALAEFAPALAGSPEAAKTCMYANTPDRHFVIGLHPHQPQVVVAAGFSGHGFKFAPVVGEILADLATNGTTPQPIGLFDPTRFAPPS